MMGPVKQNMLDNNNSSFNIDCDLYIQYYTWASL